MTAYGLDPNDEHMAVHQSFCHRFLQGEPVAPQGPSRWQFSSGPYGYPYSGYIWAWTGGHHMALSLAGKGDGSWPAA